MSKTNEEFFILTQTKSHLDSMRQVNYKLTDKAGVHRSCSVSYVRNRSQVVTVGKTRRYIEDYSLPALQKRHFFYGTYGDLKEHVISLYNVNIEANKNNPLSKIFYNEMKNIFCKKIDRIIAQKLSEIDAEIYNEYNVSC